FLFFFSSRRRHTRFDCDWSSDVCSSDLVCPCALLPKLFRPSNYASSCLFIERTKPHPFSFCFQRRATTPTNISTPQPRAAENKRSEERRVGKECRSWGSPYQ